MNSNNIHNSLVKISLCFLFLFSMFSTRADTIDEQAIQAPVLELHDVIITIMKDSSTKDFETRYELMESTIKEHFNFALISRVVLSRYWKGLNEEQQSNFIDLFTRLTVSTYVDRFNSYNEQSFKTLSVEPMKKNRYMVKTNLISPEEESVSFNYIVQKSGEQWQIISVIAKGVNDLSLKRAEYASVIKDRGFDALINSLQEKINDLQPK